MVNSMKKITSIGEILFDLYGSREKPGGAPFNFIYHIIKLTGQGTFVSRVGADERGERMRNILKEKNISDRFLQIDKTHKTGIARTNLSDDKVPDFVIEENCAYDFINKTDDLSKLIQQETDCLYFGTLAQRSEVSRNTLQSLFNKTTKYFCDLNIRQKFYSKDIIEKSINVANVLKLNEDELKLVNNLILKNSYDLENTAKEILNKFSLDLLCVTRGSKGSLLFKGNEDNYVKIKNENVIDTVGAGDAYASVLCLGYLKGFSIKKINWIASQFANEIVKVEGALPTDDSIYDTFIELLEENDE